MSSSSAYDINRKCIRPGCKSAYFRVKVYNRNYPEYFLCPKHREEQREQEAESLHAKMQERDLEKMLDRPLDLNRI